MLPYLASLPQFRKNGFHPDPSCISLTVRQSCQFPAHAAVSYHRPCASAPLPLPGQDPPRPQPLRHHNNPAADPSAYQSGRHTRSHRSQYPSSHPPFPELRLSALIMDSAAFLFNNHLCASLLFLPNTSLKSNTISHYYRSLLKTAYFFLIIFINYCHMGRPAIMRRHISVKNFFYTLLFTFILSSIISTLILTVFSYR